MKLPLAILSAVILSFGLVKPATALTHGVNGGNNCIACTVIVAIVEQLGIVYNETVDASLERLCSYLPAGLFRDTCKDAVEKFGPIIISGYTCPLEYKTFFSDLIYS